MIVADTNLLVYLHLPGEHTTAAERVLERDAEWAAPLLWRSEFRNVLALYVRRQVLTQEDALAAFERAERVVQGHEYTVETGRVLELVLASACSAYDCEFVALALELDVPLVTSDARMLSAFPYVAVAPDQFST